MCIIYYAVDVAGHTRTKGSVTVILMVFKDKNLNKMKVLYLCIVLILSTWVLIFVTFFCSLTSVQRAQVQQTPVEKDLVYVCGLSTAMGRNEELLQRIHSIVKPEKIFVVTKHVLHNLSVPVVQIKEPSSLPKERIDKISVLRNRCLREIENYNGYDWKNIKLIWVDLDMLIPDKTLRVVRGELTHNSTYDVICANGRGNFDDRFYYDISATILIDGTFTYLTPWTYMPRLNREIKFPEINKIFPHYRKFRQNKYVPVKGCFGGLAIYKFPIEECKYEAFSRYTGDAKYDRYKYNDYGKIRLCEHIPFHFCLQKRGARLAVNLGMKTFWTGH